MAEPVITVPGDGSTRVFDLNFPYLRRNHVKVYFDGAPAAFTWLNASRVETVLPAPEGTEITIRRETSETPIHVIEDGRPIPANHYNEVLLQAIYVSQEREGARGFTGPQGPAGSQGPQGPAGEQGEVGPAGPQGVPGPSGGVGARGPAGDQGPAGPQGVQGPAGPVGPVGPSGARGEQGTGIRILGTVASAAELPPSGSPGDGYIIGEDLWAWSETSSAWANVGVVRGPPGPQGPSGAQGLQGPQGPAGAQGLRGADGAAGPAGAQGLQGPQGPAGVPGWGIGGTAVAPLDENMNNALSGAISRFFNSTIAATPADSLPWPGNLSHATTVLTSASASTSRTQLAVQNSHVMSENGMAFRREREGGGFQPWRYVLNTEKHSNALWGGGHITPEWRGGRDIHIYYGDDEASKTKPIIALQRKVNVNALGTPNTSALLGWFQGEIMEGVTTPYHGMRAFMTNRGTDNDCVAWAGRTSNRSVRGMSCGTFGGAAADVQGTRATMGLEGHIYVNHGGTTAARDGSGNDWLTAIHLFSDSLSAPAHYGALIGSAGESTGKYGMWNAIGINGNAFAHNGVGNGIVGTVGLNMAWASTYADIGLKFRNVGRYHIANMHDKEIRTHARDWSQFNPGGNTDFYVRPEDSQFARVGIKSASGIERMVMFWEGSTATLGAGAGQTLAFRTGGETRFQVGTEGRIRFFSLPEDPASLATDTLWRDATNGLLRATSSGAESWVAFGDSITARAGGLSWFPYVSLRKGWKATNAAVGGATLTRDATVNSWAKQIQDMITSGELAAAHHITVSLGTNDGGFSVGTITDTGYTTIYGALNTNYATIMGVNPGARLVFTTPLHRASGDTATANCAEAIRTWCASRNIEVIDTRATCGINASNRAVLLSDGLHPTEVGAALLARTIAAKL